MKYWLLKSEPNAYSWDQMKKDKITSWDGVRNFQARNNIQSMKIGDLCFFYHSGDQRAIMGIVEVITEAYKDLSDPSHIFYTIDVQYRSDLIRPLSLKDIKTIPALSSMQLLKQPRLSVSEIEIDHWNIISELI